MSGGDGSRAAAIAAFEAWIQQLPKAPKRGVDLVREVTISHRVVGRLTSQIEGRRFVWNARPAAAKQPLSPMPADPARLDPWNPPADLDRTSRYVSTCDACRGEGKLACNLCHGSARVGCDDCGGRGKRWGTAKNGARRLLNCQSCRGKGDLKCDYCSRGRLDCETCATSKKVERWLSVDTWSRDVTLAHPPIDCEAVVVASVRGRALGVSDVPASAEWSTDGWQHIQPQLAEGERIYGQCFELLDVPSADVSYVVAGKQQTVRFDGIGLKPPPPAIDHVFARRSSRLKLATVAALAGLIVFTVWWITRGSYYVTERSGGYLVLAILSLAIAFGLGYRALWNQTLGRQRRAKLWAIPAVVPVLLAGTSVSLGNPSLERARGYLALHDVDRAAVELTGFDVRDAEANVVRADVALARATAMPSCVGAMRAASSIPESFPQHAKALAYADAMALASAKVALRDGRTADALSVLSCATPAFRASPDGHAIQVAAVVADASRCNERKDWSCALDKVRAAKALGAAEAPALESEVDKHIRAELDQTVAAARAEPATSRRLDLERRGLELANRVQTPSAATIAMLTTAEKRDSLQLAHEEEAARKRVEAERRRQEQLAAQEQARQQREERRREEAAAAAFQGVLMCNDGTASPTCSCGGSHRGCCSHHGGVAGCR